MPLAVIDLDDLIDVDADEDPDPRNLFSVRTH
jgi:hypothetical protein